MDNMFVRIWPMNMQIEGWPLKQDFFSFENGSPKYNYWGSFIYLKPNLTLAVIKRNKSLT